RSLDIVEGDVRDTELVIEILKSRRCSAVMHFAGLKSVSESVASPLRYYEHNVVGSVSLMKAVRAACIRLIVFSSSATVYGSPLFLPIDESHRLAPVNPYGQTKLIVENLLRDLHASDASLGIAILRYFNPVGAHFSGAIGEDPQGPPNNLMPYIA